MNISGKTMFALVATVIIHSSDSSMEVKLVKPTIQSKKKNKMPWYNRNRY